MADNAYALFDSPDSKQQAAFAKLLAECQVIYENATQSLGAILNGDPKKRYVWAHYSGNALAARAAAGFEIVKDSKEKAEKSPTTRPQWRQADGSYRRGDVVLMSIDKDRGDALKIYPELKAIMNLRNTRVPILEQARQANIRASLAEEDGASASKGE